MPTVSNDVIEAAIAGFQAQKQHIDAKIAELRGMLNGAHAAPVKALEAGQKKRKFSAAALKRMREAQQRRWAKVRGESSAPAGLAAKVAKTTTPKRKMSAAGRKAIADAQKKRWAAQKASAKA